MASAQPDPTKMQTDNKSEGNSSSENQSETPTNQSEGCLYDERTSIDESEQQSHEERFSNPCKRKRVPSTEYLDAIDNTDDFNSYFESLPKTDKANPSANFLITGSPSAERSARVQGPSRAEGSPCIERSAWDQGSSSTEMLTQTLSSSAEKSTLLHTLTSHSERSRSFGITPSRLECPGTEHDCDLDKHVHVDMADVTGSFASPSPDQFEDLDSEISETRAENHTSHPPCVSSQNTSHGDGETGEALPNRDYLSHQSAYTDMDTATTFSSNQNNPLHVADNSRLSTSVSFVSASSSPSIASPRKPFSISTATASSSSRTIFMSSPTEDSKPSPETDAFPNSTSSAQSSKQKFSISVMSSTSSTSQRPVFPRDFPRPEVVTEPMQGFPGVIVNTYSFEIPMKKEKSSANCSSVSKAGENDDATESPFYFNIPSYLLIQIFQHLSMYELLHNVSSVCKLWYNISHDPDLWRVIDLQNQLKVTDVVITNLTSYSDRVIYLNISDIGTISEDCLVKTMMTCNHLKTLKLSRCMSATTDKVLTAIGGHCHNLQTIHLEVCYRITDKGLEALAAGCPKLEGVHISQCQNIGNKGLASLGEHCPLLRRLSVDNCVKVQDDGIIALANGCPELRVINLNSSSIGDLGAYQLQKLKLLRTLDLSGSNELSLRTVCAIAQNCSQLECLNLSLNHNVDDGCIEMVAMHCTHLKKLYCVSCSITDTGLEFLGRHSRSLEHLDIGWCHSVTDTGVRFVSDNCPALRYIGLIRCDQVTADGIEELVDKYPRIIYSTFILESRKIIELARIQGFQFPGNNDNNK